VKCLTERQSMTRSSQSSLPAEGCADGLRR
jgi:hypothetical protein